MTALAHRVITSLIALAALSGAIFIAVHHPLSPWAVITGCMAAFLICLRFDYIWLLLLPALLPIVDLAPWTGWLTFEEFDILVLGAAAGAWLRHGWAPGAAASSRPSVTLLILTMFYLILLGIAFGRGIADANGFTSGWFQGYDGPMNSLRLAKSFLLAALFVPLFGRAASRLDARGITYLGWGMTIGLATVSLAALWERIAFPGLLNFSSDYRTTALFWEMHVGGAAFDGFLVLTLPFAVWLMVKNHHPRQLIPAGLVLALGAYASLTTFSRGVYLAIAVSFATMALFSFARGGIKQSLQSRSIVQSLAAIPVMAGLAFLSFRFGGYRALLSVLGCLTLLVLTMGDIRSASSRLRYGAGAMTAILVLLAVIMYGLSGKASYWAYAATGMLGATSWLASQRNPADSLRLLAMAGAMTLPFASMMVAHYWGGTPAFIDTVIVFVVLGGIAVWGIRSERPIWPERWRSQSLTLVSAFMLSAMIAIFSGGAYMSERFSTSERDFEGRMRHWQAGLDLLQTSGDWTFGKGLGRFPISFFLGAPGNEFPGSYRLGHEGGNYFLALAGPRYEAGFGEVLRIGQRLSNPLPAGRYSVEFDTRAKSRVKIQFGLCSKHLIYPEACAEKQIVLKGEEGWQHNKIEFDSSGFSGGAWYAPQFTVFTLAIETIVGRADVDNLELIAPDGSFLLANGDFSSDMAYWFFTSDHYHMPWHMKNMFLHVLFEQGWLGLALFLTLSAVALIRSLAGRRSHHPFAPALAASITGFLVVGLFDSLLDVPRVAFLFFLVTLLAIQGRKAR